MLKSCWPDGVDELMTLYLEVGMVTTISVDMRVNKILTSIDSATNSQRIASIEELQILWQEVTVVIELLQHMVSPVIPHVSHPVPTAEAAPSEINSDDWYSSLISTSLAHLCPLQHADQPLDYLCLPRHTDQSLAY